MVYPTGSAQPVWLCESGSMLKAPNQGMQRDDLIVHINKGSISTLCLTVLTPTPKAYKNCASGSLEDDCLQLRKGFRVHVLRCSMCVFPARNSGLRALGGLHERLSQRAHAGAFGRHGGTTLVWQRAHLATHGDAWIKPSDG